MSGEKTPKEASSKSVGTGDGSARITAGHHHGLNEGDVVKIGRTFFRVANVGVEAFNVAKLSWYIALWWHIKSAWLHLKHSLPNVRHEPDGGKAAPKAL